jgi:hypothetical protein
LDITPGKFLTGRKVPWLKPGKLGSSSPLGTDHVIASTISKPALEEEIYLENA